MTQEDEHQQLLIDELTLREQMAGMMDTEDFGMYNLIITGLKDFEVLLKARPKKPGKHAQSDLEFALWKTIESCMGGKFDPKNSGRE